jgi:hypothetical protein
VVSAASAPLAPGFVTRFGVFIRSADGLRRYDKSTDRMSAPLVTGQVGQGTAIDQVSDDRAYYVSRADANGRIDMFRVDDLLVPAVQQINVEGPLRPVGFRVLRSVVLYALEGRSDWRSWRKSDGVRADVLDGENIALASTLHDQLFTLFANANGDAELAQGLPDGTQRRTFGAARLLGGSLADEVSPYARHLRRNAAYGHALIATPPGAGSNGELRWLGFGGATGDALAGVFPQGLQVDADWQSPGIMGAQALVGIRKTGTSERYLFVARRAPASLTRAADGVQ